MKRLACLAIVVATATAHAEDGSPPTTQAAANDAKDQVRLDLAASGPGGLIAVRYSRVLPTGMRIEPALGLAYTGVLGSMLVTQPFAQQERTTKGGTSYTTTFEVYGGYGASVMRDYLHHPWAGREGFVPNGTYHWVDFGLSSQNRLRSWLLTIGVGASILLSAPMFEPHEDDQLWFIFPEGWMAKQHWVPSLWTSVGYAF